jgi:hypothetical protein
MAALFLSMEKENGKSGGKQYINVHSQGTKFNPNVKGVGQECPSHTSPSNMEVIELQAVAEDNSKRTGEAVEAAFLNKVCGLRIPVCKPWGDSERYDFVVDWGKGCGSGRQGQAIHEGGHGLRCRAYCA